MSAALNEAVVQYGHYIAIVDEGVPLSQKTRVYRVQTMTPNQSEAVVILGTVKWFGRWRGYAFFPCEQMVFEKMCLRDIADFCETVTREHTARRKGAKS